VSDGPTGGGRAHLEGSRAADQPEHAAGALPPLAPRFLWPGTVGPSTGTPDRRPGSVRRTVSLDLVRPDGLEGVLVMEGRGRDLATRPDGTATVLARTTVRVVVDFMGDRHVLDITSDPPEPALAGLVGGSTTSGFRAAATAAVPEDRRSGSLLYQLLDDVPIGVMISGGVLDRNGVRLPRVGPARLPAANICAGWVPEGLMTQLVIERGEPGLVGIGPPVPGLASADADAWHDMPPLSATSMRRRRRLDVAPSHDSPEVLEVTGLLRDSYAEPDGSESGVHEYTLTATVDRRDLVVLTAEATPRVLPGPDCPAAAASAGWLAGHHVDELRDWVREQATGPATCTHLNDALRTLGDLGRLVSLLPPEVAEP
jgi:Protein of unknown function (DUF2889)